VVHKTPPFATKEVTLVLLWIAIIVLAVGAIVLMIWRAPGHRQIQPQSADNPGLSLTQQTTA